MDRKQSGNDSPTDDNGKMSDGNLGYRSRTSHLTQQHAATIQPQTFHGFQNSGEQKVNTKMSNDSEDEEIQVMYQKKRYGDGRKGYTTSNQISGDVGFRSNFDHDYSISEGEITSAVERKQFIIKTRNGSETEDFQNMQMTNGKNFKSITPLTISDVPPNGVRHSKGSSNIEQIMPDPIQKLPKRK